MYKCLAVLTAFVFSLIVVIPSYAQLGDITAAETATIDLAGLKDGDDSSYNISAVVPYEKINGGFQAYFSQQQNDGEVTSESIRARVEGGVSWWKIDLIGFAQIERFFKESTTTTSIGPFIRLPAYTDGELTITSGLGSWLQNQTIQEEVGAEASLSAYSVRPFAYASADYGPINVFGKLSTDFEDFNDVEVEVIPSVVWQLNDNVSLGALAQYRWAKLGDMGITSRYSAVGRYTF